MDKSEVCEGDTNDFNVVNNHKKVEDSEARENQGEAGETRKRLDEDDNISTRTRKRFE